MQNQTNVPNMPQQLLQTQQPNGVPMLPMPTQMSMAISPYGDIIVASTTSPIPTSAPTTTVAPQANATTPVNQPTHPEKSPTQSATKPVPNKGYKKKPETGHEYVDSAKAFAAYVTLCATKLPGKWKDWILDPMVGHAKLIRNLTLEANKVYIYDMEKTPQLAYTGLKQRAELLQKAVRTFQLFDQDMEDLMGQVDLLYSEQARVRDMIQKIVYAENKARKDTGKDVAQEITLKIRTGLCSVEFSTAVGTKQFRFGFTDKKRDHMLDLEAKAQQMITRRLSSDIALIKKLEATIGKTP